MGTRNLTCVIADGKYKVAQYGQWDGNPSCGGTEILEALSATTPKRLRKRAMACVVVNEKKLKAMWAKFGVTTDMCDIETSQKFSKAHPTIYRNLGCGIIKHLAESTGPVDVQLNLEFAGDGLFCEWAYVIDLDQGTFEVYEGYKKNRHEGQRFSHLQQEDGEYAPVALIKSYSLNDLPDVQQFIKDVCPEDDEDDDVPAMCTPAVEDKQCRMKMSLSEMKDIVDAVEDLSGDNIANVVRRFKNKLEKEIE